jgi:hypothetical protein
MPCSLGKDPFYLSSSKRKLMVKILFRECKAGEEDFEGMNVSLISSTTLDMTSMVYVDRI